jgi:hypothetical protein
MSMVWRLCFYNQLLVLAKAKWEGGIRSFQKENVPIGINSTLVQGIARLLDIL